MQIFTQLPQLYRSAANTINNQVRWAGKGFRAAPAPPPGLSAPTKFFWPRTVNFIESESGGRTTIADSGWITGDFRALMFDAHDGGTGANLFDYWNIWIAETESDLLIPPGSSFTAGLVYDPTSGLYTSADNAGHSVAKPVLIIDQTGTAPVTTGAMNLSSPYDKIYGTIIVTTIAAVNVEVDFVVAGKAIKMFSPTLTATGTTVNFYTFSWGFGGTGTFVIPGTPSTNAIVTVPAQASVTTAEIIAYEDF